MISCDPGIRHCGVAGWYNGELLWACLVSTDQIHLEKYGISIALADKTEPLVIEKPQVYQSMKVDPGDLIDLAIVVGRLIGMSPREAVLYKPQAWKGQAPKNVITERTLAALSKDEIERIILPKAKKTLGHNVYDAIGLGLAHLRKTGVRVGKCFSVNHAYPVD